MESTFDTAYPRPRLVKGHWQILSGGWTLNGKPIRVPYPPEAPLSGFAGEVPEALTYRKHCQLSSGNPYPDGRLLLHFGAVDQIAEVFINDKSVCRHEGGYTPFTADITPFLSGTDFDLRVEVLDRLDQRYPYGKQRKNRGGMWYTPVSGIWQSVWCEWVPQVYIRDVKVLTTETTARVQVQMSQSTDQETEISLDIDGVRRTFATVGHELTLDLSQFHQPIQWSCEKPHLYPFTVRCCGDEAASYFGLRRVSIEQVEGLPRICLNGKPVFLNGVLDQGYFRQGLFLPETPEEYDRDILRMKELGFNTLRKHIKVEPELWYYACDRLGMLVMQDMVNNGPYRFFPETALPTIGLQKRDDRRRYRDPVQRAQFLSTAEEAQDLLYSHPCVIGYTIFNEGWGQTDSDEIGDHLKARDPSRFYDYTSGWFAQKHSDVESLHIYFRAKKLRAKDKPLLLSEFGGFARAVEGHVFDPKASYGYGTCKNERELTDRILNAYETMVRPAILKGLCGAIYTQLSDIEEEINGFYTYDRQVCKVDKERLSSAFWSLKL